MDLSAHLKRFAAAVEAGDGDALANLFTPDGVYDDYFFGPQNGRQAIKTMLAHFSDGGRDFRWDFFDPVLQGDLGYASYRFSYTSKAPEAEGARVTFDGISRIAIDGGLIKHYSEVFDRGMALAQQNFAPERMRRIGQKYAAALKVRPDWARHAK
jgi:ketosteroid isomerase-like protein